MQKIILLEKLPNLGKLGDQIKVKSGYARNFLIPQGKALFATKININIVKNKIDKINFEIKLTIEKAQEKAMQISKIKEITIFAKVGKDKKLFGSVGKRNIAENITKETGILIKKNEIILVHGPLKLSGKHIVNLQLHHNIIVKIVVNIKPDNIN